MVTWVWGELDSIVTWVWGEHSMVTWVWGQGGDTPIDAVVRAAAGVKKS